jgi:carbon storage regulator
MEGTAVMLVLTRKRTDSIKIGDDVVIRVIDLGTKSVRLGIEAPPEVRILRGELTEYPPAETCEPTIEPPFVADAVTDAPAADEPVVLGPMTAERFLAEFNDTVPGRSIRRWLDTKRPTAKSAAK